MAIPMATTRISVLRLTAAQADAEPYSGDIADLAPTRDVIAAGVRAHIGAGSGVELTNGGEQSHVTFRMDCDPTDLTHLDWIKDESDGQIYEVVWSRLRRGLGMDHVEADVEIVAGLV